MDERFDRMYKCFTDGEPGVFSALAYYGVPWDDDISGQVLDDIYIGTYSGSKPPSRMVRRYCAISDGPLTQAQVDRIARMLWTVNGADWVRLWEAEIAEYDPVSNYDMVEQMTGDRRDKTESGRGTTAYGKTQTLTDSRTTQYGNTDTRTDDLATQYGGTDTRTDDLTTSFGRTDTRTDQLQTARTGTDTTTGTTSSEAGTSSDHDVYGLNSETAVPSDKDTTESTATESKTETLTHNVTDAHTGTQSTAAGGADRQTGTQVHAKTGTDRQTGTQVHAKTGSDSITGTSTDASSGTDTTTDERTSSETHSYTLTRKGNIGVMTSQDMLTQERVLRAWRIFYDRVFPDVDRMLTLCIY